MVPFENSRISSALLSTSGLLRCVIKIAVPDQSINRCSISSAIWLSRFAVGSSARRTSGLRNMERAMPIRCACLPERLFSLISLCSPCGSTARRSPSPAYRAVARTSSSVHLLENSVIFSSTVPLKRNGLCGMTAIVRVIFCRVILRTSFPPQVIVPSKASYSPAMTLASVDFPAPDAPTSTYFLPSSKV